VAGAKDRLQIGEKPEESEALARWLTGHLHEKQEFAT
jgi:hypothetical protein